MEPYLYMMLLGFSQGFGFVTFGVVYLGAFMLVRKLFRGKK